MGLLEIQTAQQIARENDRTLALQAEFARVAAERSADTKVATGRTHGVRHWLDHLHLGHTHSVRPA